MDIKNTIKRKYREKRAWLGNQHEVF